MLFTASVAKNAFLSPEDLISDNAKCVDVAFQQSGVVTTLHPAHILTAILHDCFIRQLFSMVQF